MPKEAIDRDEDEDQASHSISIDTPQQRWFDISWHSLYLLCDCDDCSVRAF